MSANCPFLQASSQYQDLDRLPPQNEERFGSLGQEPGELMDQNMLNLIGLLDLDADADGVDARLDKNSLVLVTRDGQRRKKDLWRCLGLNFGNVVSLGCLRGEVGECKRCGQAAPHTLQVWPQGLGLQRWRVSSRTSMEITLKQHTMITEAGSPGLAYTVLIVELSVVVVVGGVASWLV